MDAGLNDRVAIFAQRFDKMPFLTLKQFGPTPLAIIRARYAKN